LDLEPPGEGVDHSRKLGQPEYPVAGEVGDMRVAIEGQQVVFA